LQGEALAIWHGQNQNKAAAQAVFFKRVKSVALARQGRL